MLQEELNKIKQNFEANADTSVIELYDNGVNNVAQSGILDQAKNVGDKAPNFKLNNALGNNVELKDYLAKGNVVLTWYRGGWCPYCNLTLRALQAELPNFKANNATLLALTPELPDKSLSTSEKHNLEFEVLSDVGNKVAKDFGIMFKLPNDVASNYKNHFSLEEFNGDDSNELPLAATYIINTNGKITYAFLDADYRNRAEPTEITKALQTL